MPPKKGKQHQKIINKNKSKTQKKQIQPPDKVKKIRKDPKIQKKNPKSSKQPTKRILRSQVSKSVNTQQKVQIKRDDYRKSKQLPQAKNDYQQQSVIDVHPKREVVDADANRSIIVSNWGQKINQAMMLNQFKYVGFIDNIIICSQDSCIIKFRQEGSARRALLMNGQIKKGKPIKIILKSNLENNTIKLKSNKQKQEIIPIQSKEEVFFISQHQFKTTKQNKHKSEKKQTEEKRQTQKVKKKQQQQQVQEYEKQDKVNPINIQKPIPRQNVPQQQSSSNYMIFNSRSKNSSSGLNIPSCQFGNISPINAKQQQQDKFMKKNKQTNYKK